MWWFLLIIVFVAGYTIYYKVSMKKYQESGLMEEHNSQLKEEIRKLLELESSNLSDKLFVNGHFTRQTSFLLNKTTYYSYVLVFDVNNSPIIVYSYLPEEKDIQLVGEYPLSQIKAIPYGSVGTNYLFHDETGKQLFSVQTVADVLPSASEYQLNYSQPKEYQALRSRFGLT
jgi:hypothetical protein